nr:reverse transcriptase domain-containing protein [Tanacetum cinerariifolium]
MTLELANRAIYTPTGIARDVFVSVGKFTFPANFFIVDYKSDPKVPLILGRPFLRTARALIEVHGEEMILRDGDERLTLNMGHDTSSYSNQPQKESINLIDVFNDSNEDFLKNLFSTNQPSGNPTFSSHPELTSPEVKDDIFDAASPHREDLNQLWRLVKETLSNRPPTSDKEMELWVQLSRLCEPDNEDKLWTHTQNFMHAPVEWKLYDNCGVHHVTSKDNEIFMLVEKDYPLRKGLALVMISYKLQVENYSQMANDLILKIYKIENSPR